MIILDEHVVTCDTRHRRTRRGPPAKLTAMLAWRARRSQPALLQEINQPRCTLTCVPCHSSTSCFMPARHWCECCLPAATAVSSSDWPLCPHSPQFRRLLRLARCRSIHMARACPSDRYIAPRICHQRQRQQQQHVARERHCCDAGQGHARAFADKLDGARAEHLSW
jgi:hypothetical protein